MGIETRYDTAARLASRIGATAFAARLFGGRLLTLCYHGVTPRYVTDGECDLTGHVSVELFRSQLDWLAEHMQFVDLDQVIGSMNRRLRLPRRSVLITFDDGFLNNFEYALPVMKEFGIRPVFFVPSEPVSRPDRPLWYLRIGLVTGRASGPELSVPTGVSERFSLRTPADRASAYRRLHEIVSRWPAAARLEFTSELERLNPTSPLSSETHRLFFAHADWDTIQRASDDADIGGHTVTHPALKHMDEESARREIEENRRVIADRIGVDPRAFAFPFGSRDYCGPREERIVAETGYEAGFTLVPQWMEGTTNRFALPRHNVSPVKLETFTMVVSGMLDFALWVKDTLGARRELERRPPTVDRKAN
ncbi:MAG: polysaccharide deacetylase family protein [Phycisphaerae bacterium]|nr:polysaccharide deacetylase family protein [Phycisphaerae bacterium]